MKIGVIQLSDIHIRYATDAVLGRGREIVAALLGAIPSADAYLLALSGDIAFSGRVEEYKLARGLVGSILEQFHNVGRQVFIAMTPGNHDLDFSTEPDTRPLLLASLNDKIGSLDPEGEIVRQIVSIQSAFFDFEATVTNMPKRSGKDCLTHANLFRVGEKILCVRTYNTAWVSTNPEIQGQLLFPATVVSNSNEHADLTISIFHHPYNWLAQENARLFRHAVEASSDVVLTGHEHESELYERANAATGSIQYIEAAVLQEARSERSGFNSLCIDTDAGTYDSFCHRWQDHCYIASSGGSHQFIRNKLLCMSQFHISEEFLDFLNDPGLPIRHPKKLEVKLDDLFVYPSMIYRTLDKPTTTPKIIRSDGVLEHMRAAKSVVIVGDDTIGKSSFAKRLYRDLNSDGTTLPLLLTGAGFKGFSDRDIRKVVRAAVVEQYGESASERYFAIDQTQRAVIIDDWQGVAYNVRGRAQIIRHLTGFFGKVICLTNRFHELEEIVEPGSTKSAFADFEHCEMKEFGEYQTGKLIEKWHALGRESSLDPSEFHYAVADSENKIATVMGKGLLPAYPIFLVGLLQADASPSPTSQNVGSYGHVLEALITARITEVSARSTDIGLMYTYLSRVAYFIFKNDRPFISEQELSALHAEYCSLYNMKLSEQTIVRDMISAKLLTKDGQSYKFRYRGCYCYFVARYFSENIIDGPSALRTELNDITDKLIYDDFTCIVMFYMYLTRDAALIERLLTNAAAIYADTNPSKLEDDVEFVNKLLLDKPEKLLLPSTDIAANRERVRLQHDEAEGRVPEDSYRIPVQRVRYSEGLDEIVKINIALQSIRVMGQVLRNFPGVLTGEPKFRLTEACYLLGLRTLGRFLELANTQRETLRLILGRVFKDKHPLATDEEVAKSADQALIWLAGAASYGVVKRICHSVGVKDLELTYEDVKAKHGGMTSIRLIHLAIRLEHFRGVPETDIYEIEKSLGRNYFAYKLLRDLVAEYLLLFNTDRKVLQRLGAQFDIKTSDPRFQLDKAIKSSDD